MAEVETNRDGAVLTITLNRPEVLNAFTAEMHRQLVAAFKEARDGAVRAVVITGAGRELEKPVLAAVNGPAAGAGLSLACACDLRIAAAGATFVPAFISIGLVPDSGGTYFVRRLLGTARAFELFGTGRRLTAPEAQAWGLVSEVVESANLATRAAELAAELAALPTRALGMTKRLFDHADHATLDQQLAFEAMLQAEATQTADFHEGVAAFLE